MVHIDYGSLRSALSAFGTLSEFSYLPKGVHVLGGVYLHRSTDETGKNILVFKLKERLLEDMSASVASDIGGCVR